MIGGELALGQFHGLRRHFVQQVAVVGDDDNALGIIENEALKLIFAGHIEVVVGFIQQQNVRGGYGQLHQRHHLFLTAGERGCRQIEVIRAETQHRQQFAHMAGVAVAVHRFKMQELRLELSKCLRKQRFIAVDRRIGQLAFDGAQVFLPPGPIPAA